MQAEQRDNEVIAARQLLAREGNLPELNPAGDRRQTLLGGGAQFGRLLHQNGTRIDEMRQQGRGEQAGTGAQVENGDRRIAPERHQAHDGFDELVEARHRREAERFGLNVAAAAIGHCRCWISPR